MTMMQRNYSYYEKFIDTTTKKRCDVTPLFSHPDVFSQLIDDLSIPWVHQCDVVAALDALGFVIGGAIASRYHKPLVVVRKGGKLPGKHLVRVSFVDYTKSRKYFEMNTGSIKKGQRVLIVDEWIETAAQVNAAISLVEKQGGKIIGISAISMDTNTHTRLLSKKYHCHALNQRQ